MTIENDLLLASVSWRGRPTTYTPGALGDIGDRFRVAFDRFTIRPEISTQFTFEYFTGLLFNGDYSDLESLTALVASWLSEPPPEALHVIQEIEAGVLRIVNGPDVSVRITPGWYRHRPWGRTMPPDLVVSHITFDIPVYVTYPGLSHLDGQYLVTGRFGGDGYTTPGHPIPKPFGDFDIAYLVNHPSLGIRYENKVGTRDVGTARQIQHDGLPTNLDLCSAGMELLAMNVAEVWFYLEVGDAATTDGFKTRLVDSIRDYVAGELSDNRTPPAITSTASANNGFVFKNWAEGKYGATVAQGVE